MVKLRDTAAWERLVLAWLVKTAKGTKATSQCSWKAENESSYKARAQLCSPKSLSVIAFTVTKRRP